VTAGLEAGSDFAGFRVDGLLAAGGMGVVYRAREIESGRPVALKLIGVELAHDETFRRRFEREARLAAELDHPNVVPVVASGEHDGALYMASALIEGLNLHEAIAESELTARAAANVVGQVAAALDAAHARGLLHRDVKPGNVLLDGSPGGGTAYLTDFGLSKHVSSQSGLTRTGRWVGTVDYAAPEQLQAADMDLRVDVYALGCVLYEALTGEVPFPRARELQKMIAHIGEPPPAVSARRPGAASFDAVVQRAMAKEPEERFESAGTLGQAAREAATECGEDESDEPRTAPAPGRPAPGDAPTAA
jgi:serine/threonine-protein kinase